jgi:glycosyltransferase involved in cell wall biosynthesis
MTAIRVRNRLERRARTRASFPTAGQAKITHVITGLEVGGAEMMLYKLLSRIDRERFASEVVSLTSAGPVGRMLAAIGVPVTALRMEPRLPQAMRALLLVRHLRRSRPAIIQTWMYHADLVGGAASLLAHRPAVIWGIRQTLDPTLSKEHALRTARVCAKLSGRIPTKIVCCAESVSRVHAGLGYAADKLMVIPNGFDTESFAPDAGARTSVRTELGVDSKTPLVGVVARYDVKKGHGVFVDAARTVADRHPAAHFVLCGRDVDARNAELMTAIARARLDDRFHLLGRRSDVARLTASLDVAVSTSLFGEGFSNALGEAMACGVPCVATDVGDAALIVGDTGAIVPAGEPIRAATAIGDLLALGDVEREALGRAARARIEERFGLSRVVPRFEALYTELIGERPTATQGGE